MISMREMPEFARVWVYQANRPFTSDEKGVIKKEAEGFLDSWAAHGAKLMCSYEIYYDVFLVLAVDEEQAKASGCSIDKSVHFILDLEKKLNIRFMDRMLFAYKEGETPKIVARDEFTKLVSSGVVHDDTIVFNNLVHTKKELDTNWQLPLKRSWHKQLV